MKLVIASNFGGLYAFLIAINLFAVALSAAAILVARRMKKERRRRFVSVLAALPSLIIASLVAAFHFGTDPMDVFQFRILSGLAFVMSILAIVTAARQSPQAAR